MALDCDPSTLANAARCFDSCIPPGMQLAVQTYLLAQIANAAVGTSTDPSVLAKAASGFIAPLSGMQLEAQVYLLCQLANA